MKSIKWSCFGQICRIHNVRKKTYDPVKLYHFQFQEPETKPVKSKPPKPILAKKLAASAPTEELVSSPSVNHFDETRPLDDLELKKPHKEEPVVPAASVVEKENVSSPGID